MGCKSFLLVLPTVAVIAGAQDPLNPAAGPEDRTLYMQGHAQKPGAGIHLVSRLFLAGGESP